MNPTPTKIYWISTLPGVGVPNDEPHPHKNLLNFYFTRGGSAKWWTPPPQKSTELLLYQGWECQMMNPTPTKIYWISTLPGVGVPNDEPHPHEKAGLTNLPFHQGWQAFIVVVVFSLHPRSSHRIQPQEFLPPEVGWGGLLLDLTLKRKTCSAVTESLSICLKVRRFKSSWPSLRSNRLLPGHLHSCPCNGVSSLVHNWEHLAAYCWSIMGQHYFQVF